MRIFTLKSLAETNAFSARVSTAVVEKDGFRNEICSPVTV